MAGSELGPFSERRNWRLIRRLGQFIDPDSSEALARVESSRRVRIPRDAPLARRLGAEALDSFLEHSASFPALIRGLSAGDIAERLVAIDHIQELAIRDIEVARELAQQLEQDVDPEVADRAHAEVAILADPGYQP
ncbi:hypothetical protein [Leekyejoonella antrihumi]|uniref:Uncharacterized protein n=1 Tax=Leekyejoonella antrihumi TaxID=1660198 RepID=A0A563DWN4_9MICO|nr:hypothetical protein [Leekyejoonella antrihumi]TWP34352.1 hypothetical protein FGL98_18150 [Leekyejoonella antrihumi]